MKNIRLILLCIFSTALLCGCNDDKTSTNYLLAHPYYLKAELEKCHLHQIENQAYCDKIKATARRIVNLIEEVQSDAEQYGDDVLRLQMKKDQLKSQSTDTSQDNKTSQPIKMQLKTVKNEIKERLAILGLNSPE